MKIYDLTLPISPNMPVWPGDPSVTLELVESMNQGDHVNVTRLSMSAHTGTHVDAPHHFLNDGRTVEALALDILLGPCYVLQLPDDVDEITADVLTRSPIPDGVTRLLIGTSNSHIWSHGEMRFQENFVAVSEDGAIWLTQHGIRLIGIDYLSIAPFGDSDPTHKVLLGAGVVIVEGLNLSAVPRGFYNLVCLPLKLVGADGAPARVVLTAD